jgi:signal transduction histidine kinase
LHNIERNNLLAEMQTRFASQEKEFENEGLRKQQLAKDELIQTQSNFLYVVIGASLLLLVFSIYEFVQYRKKQQLNNELTRLNEDISKQKDELELQAIELSKLTKEIEDKNKLLEKDNEQKALSIQDKEKRILDFAFFNAHELRACVARILGLVNVFKHSYYSKEDLTNIVDMVEKSTLGLDVIVKDFGNRLINIESEDALDAGVEESEIKP